MEKEKLAEIFSKYLDNNLAIPIGFRSCLIWTKCGWEGDYYTDHDVVIVVVPLARTK